MLVAVASTAVEAGSAPAPANVPQTAAASHEAGSMARAERAFTTYMAALASQEPHALSRAMTDDATVEYAASVPGTYRTVAGYALFPASGCMAAHAQAQRISNVWIFPTADSNTVFVQYEANAAPTSRCETSKRSNLLMLELRGDRISRLRSFGPET